VGDPGVGGVLEGIPGAAKRRGVGQVEVADLGDSGPVGDRGGQNVDPLGNPAPTWLRSWAPSSRPLSRSPISRIGGLILSISTAAPIKFP
jgi:hypothetical protein